MIFSTDLTNIDQAAQSSLRLDCKKLYERCLATASTLAEEHFIILDTNVLLGYYELPQLQQGILFNFVAQNLHRIICTPQILKEFKRHQKKIQHGVLKKIHEHPNLEKYERISTKIKDYSTDNEELLEAYPRFKNGLENSIAEIAKVSSLLRSYTPELNQQLKALYLQHDWEQLIEKLPCTPPLNSTSTIDIKKAFDQLSMRAKAQIDEATDDAYKYFFSKNPQLKFPGYADLLKKPKNPYGDFIIFHEIINWLIAENPVKPPVFLTNDIAKGDWLDEKKRPYWHYFEHMYQVSNNIFFILHAADTFETVHQHPFQHLVSRQQFTDDLYHVLYEYRNSLASEKITPSSLLQLLDKTYPYRQKTEIDTGEMKQIIEILDVEFGINSIHNLQEDLINNYHLLVDYELKNFCYLDQIEALEQTLDLIFE